MSKGRRDRIEDLRRAFDEFGAIRFPDQSEHDRVWEVHADMAMFDTFVAGSVSSLLSGGQWTNQIKVDPDLEDYLLRIAQEDGPDAQDARTYLEYVQALNHLVRLAEEWQR
jgi:hypothetical protein